MYQVTEKLDFHYFATTRVPRLKHERSHYFHTLNVLIETHLEKKDNSSLEKEGTEMEKTSIRLHSYSMRDRNKLDPDHRLLLWVLRARLFYLSYHFCSTKNSINIDSNYLKKTELSISDKSLTKHSLSEYFRILIILCKNFNQLKGNKSLQSYVDALMHSLT